MTLHHLKLRLAGLLRRAAAAIEPPPLILPPATHTYASEAERVRQFERIAFTAIAWMGHVADLKARAAAASIIKRTYPGIAAQIEEAHRCAMAFQPQLQQLLIDEEARANAAQEEPAC